MTDYFALLDQPQQPWLDTEELRQVFHQKTLQAHPDAQTQPGKNETFTQLNEAYQVLREPKRRLHHLLSLEGNPPATKNVSIPANIGRLFPAVGALMQELDGVIRKVANPSNALSRSLVRPELLKAAEHTRQILETLAQLHEEAVTDLRELNKSWRPGETDQTELHALYLQFSYITRWIGQLEEKQMQLTSAL